MRRYQHLDMADLEAKLQEASGARVKLIATDGTTQPGSGLLPVPGYDLLLHAADEGFVIFSEIRSLVSHVMYLPLSYVPQPSWNATCTKLKEVI